jgi:hypothetical protein
VTVTPVPDSVLEVYREVAERMHGSMDRDMGNEPDQEPDEAVVVGEAPGGVIYRLVDGWGSYYVLEKT